MPIRTFYCKWCGHDGFLPNGGKVNRCKSCGRKDGIMYRSFTKAYMRKNLPEIKETGLQIHCMVNTFFQKMGY